MVLRWGVVNFVDLLGGVDNLGLDGFLVDDRDDVLMNMVMNWHKSVSGRWLNSIDLPCSPVATGASETVSLTGAVVDRSLN